MNACRQIATLVLSIVLGPGAAGQDLPKGLENGVVKPPVVIQREQDLPKGLENGVLRPPAILQQDHQQPWIIFPNRGGDGPLKDLVHVIDRLERGAYADAMWRGVIQATVVITFVLGSLAIFYLFLTRRRS